MKKKIIDRIQDRVQRKHDEEERRGWGKGTVLFNSWEEFKEKVADHSGGIVSPGGAASMLGVSRSYLSQLEKEGKITVYRIWHTDIDWKTVPFWIKAMVPKKEIYAFITVDEVERVRDEMIRTAEEKIKRLQGR
jgi:hypothetical protein